MIPDFLCIGAQKAGTTWLYRQLRMHPDAWLPPVKELHYFDRDAHRKAHGPLARLREPGTRHALREWLSRLHHQRREGDLAWGWRYFTGRRDDQWYVSLFDTAAGRLVGEFTPAYSAMPANRVEHAARVAPGARIIFLLRNPVDRAWSHAVMNLCRFTGRTVDEVAGEDFQAHFRSPGSRRRGDYLRTIDTWERAFSPGNVLVRFYEELKYSPDELLTTACRFLDLDPAPLLGNLPANVTPINPGNYNRIPRHLERALCTQYHPALRQLAERFGEPATTWLEQAEKVLDGA